MRYLIAVAVATNVLVFPFVLAFHGPVSGRVRVIRVKVRVRVRVRVRVC